MSEAPKNIANRIARTPFNELLTRIPLSKEAQADPRQTVFLSDTMTKMLTEQVGRETFSAYLYMGMAGYFDAAGLDGFAKYFRTASCEEMAHARKVHDYLLECGDSPTLPPMGESKGSYESVESALKKALEHEMSVTADWKRITAQARDDADAPTEELAQWFMTEQIEEESKIIKLIQRLSYGGPGAALLLDIQLLNEE